MRKGSFVGDTLYGVNVGKIQFPCKYCHSDLINVSAISFSKQIRQNQFYSFQVIGSFRIQRYENSSEDQRSRSYLTKMNYL